jgi:hypothetical protein
MPAAKLRPVRPSTATVPPVMYSQPWSPVPSTTAEAPELRTQKRSPATPRKKTSPSVAPYKHGVADDDVLARNATEGSGRTDDDAPAGKSLAHVVVGFAGEVERDAARQEGAEALPGGAGQLDGDAVVGRPSAPLRFATSCDSRVPTVRFWLRIGDSITTFSPRSRAGPALAIRLWSRARTRP